MKKILGTVVVFLFVLVLPGLAQEISANEVVGSAVEAQAIPAEEVNVDVALLALGTVVRAEESHLVISEYEYETDMDQENRYLIKDQTEFVNVAGSLELKPGDSVEIVYQESGNERIALAVTKEENYIESDEKIRVPLINEEVNGVTAATESWDSKETGREGNTTED